MQQQRATEWLNTTEGLIKAALMVLGLPAVVTAAAVGVLSPLVRVAPAALQVWIERGLPLLVALILVWVFWRSYRRFASASRIEQPDAFNLRATNPESLIGRGDDLDHLL